MTDVLITLEPGSQWAEVLSPFSAKNIIKSFPPGSRKWDAGKHCWLIRATLTGQLQQKFKDAGLSVEVVELPAPVSPKESGKWADILYAALGSDLADRAYQALARVLHPDAGGDTAAMQSLNRARDRAHGRNMRSHQ